MASDDIYLGHLADAIKRFAEAGALVDGYEREAAQRELAERTEEAKAEFVDFFTRALADRELAEWRAAIWGDALPAVEAAERRFGQEEDRYAGLVPLPQRAPRERVIPDLPAATYAAMLKGL